MTRGTALKHQPQTDIGHRPIRRAQKRRPYVPKRVLHPLSDDGKRNAAIAAVVPKTHDVLDRTPNAVEVFRKRVRQLSMRFRADRAANVVDLVELFLDARNTETGICNPGNTYLARMLEVNEKTIRRIVNEVLEPAGIIAVVSRAVKLPDAANGEAQAYVLLQPKPPVAEIAGPVDINVHLKRNNQGYTNSLIGDTAKTRGNDPTQHLRPRPGARRTLHQQCWEMAERLKRNIPDLRNAWTGALAKFIRPFVAAGDTLRDLKHRIDWAPWGFKWQFTNRVTAAIGWVRYRMRDWFDDDGAIIPINPNLPTNPTTIHREETPLELCADHELEYQPVHNGKGGCIDCRVAHHRRQEHQSGNCILCKVKSQENGISC